MCVNPLTNNTKMKTAAVLTAFMLASASALTNPDLFVYDDGRQGAEQVADSIDDGGWGLAKRVPQGIRQAKDYHVPAGRAAGCKPSAH